MAEEFQSFVRRRVGRKIKKGPPQTTPTGTLRYRPPGWNGGDPTLSSSFPGYTVVNCNSTTETLNLSANTDYYINLGTKTWSSISSGRSIGLHINGGRNVVLVGGAFNMSSTNSTDDSTGILVDVGTDGGIVHLEGLQLTVVNPITIRTRRTVQIQNCRLVAQSFQDNHANIHPDLVQVWGTTTGSNGTHTPCAAIKMHKVSAYTTFTGLVCLVEITPTSSIVDPVSWARWDVDLHPQPNFNGSNDAGHYAYLCSGPTGTVNNVNFFPTYEGEVYCQLPTFGGGAGTRGIDDITILKTLSPSAQYWPYEIHNSAGTTLYTSPLSPSGGSGLALAKTSGNYLKMSRVAPLSNHRFIIGTPPASAGAINGEFCPASVPGPNYVSPLYL